MKIWASQEKTHNMDGGIPVLGDPTVNEFEEEPMKIVMQIGNDVMLVDGKVILDQPPMIVKETSRTLVPLRAVFEAAGFIVGWDEQSKTITIER